MKKWIALFIVLGMAGFGVFTSLIMIGPEMKSQPNIRAYQARFPLPPAGVVPVEADSGHSAACDAEPAPRDCGEPRARQNLL